MSDTRKPWTARRIHLWVSIALAVPMALVAISGVLISMRSVTSLTVPMSWLGNESLPERLPITAYAVAADGARWIGNDQGLYRVVADAAEPVAHFAGQDIVAIALRAGEARPVVATRMAVWEEKDGQWSAVRRGRVRQLSTLPDGAVFVISGGRGEFADGKPFVSRRAGEWRPDDPAQRAHAALPKIDEPRVPLHQAMRHLHSGAFLFGKGPGEMIWSNVLGWVLMGLVLTGLWMWLKAERVKARKRVSKLATTGRQPGPVGDRLATLGAGGE